MGLYFEDFQDGQEFRSGGRTVTEAHLVAFAGVSGDQNPLHVDAEFARSEPFQERIAHGLLGLSIMTGLVHDLGILVGSVVAFTGLDWRFKAPVKIGDTIRGEMRVRARKGLQSQGLVAFDAKLLNQRGETVGAGAWSLMFKRRPKAPSRSSGTEGAPEARAA